MGCFSQILFFDVWLLISTNVEVFSIVVYWFLKVSGFFSLDVVGELFNNLKSVFKAKQLQAKLLFLCEEDEWRYLCWVVFGRCFEQHDMLGPFIVKVSLEQPKKEVNFNCYPLCWGS